MTDRVRRPRTPDQAIKSAPPPKHLEEPPLAVEAIVAAGEAAGGQFGGDDAVLDARATCSGFMVIEPKLTRMPADKLEAIVSMWRTSAAPNFISLAAAAAAAKMPMVPDEWKPLL